MARGYTQARLLTQDSVQAPERGSQRRNDLPQFPFSKSGADGNDLGTLLPPEVAVPLATYTGWNLRRREAGAEAMLASLTGSYIPFARTAAERRATGDPRPSIEERYKDFETYKKQLTATCQDLVKQRLLLPEDADRVIQKAAKAQGLFLRPEK